MHAVTLHVGAATFRPIKTPRIEDHALLPERAVLSAATAEASTPPARPGRRVVAVGTTATRTLETAAGDDGRVAPLDGLATAFLHPGHRFRVVDALLTNFHLPRSSLLVLVAAFAGPRADPARVPSRAWRPATGSTRTATPA